MISVIIPCYNTDKYIRQCLDSLVMQSSQNLEIICINDGSTDHTSDILNEYAANDNRLKIIHQTNAGISLARNVGLVHSKGDFIMFVDSDDWLEKDSIAKTFEIGFDLICFSYNRVFKARKEARIFNYSGIFAAKDVQRRIVGLTGKELEDPTQANSMITVWGKIYSADIIKKNDIKFINTSEIGSAEDALFNLQYLNYCRGKVKVMDSPFYNYRKDNTVSFTSTYKPQLFEQWKVLHKKIAETVLGKGIDFEEAYCSRIALSLIGLGLNEMESKDSAVQIGHRISTILNHPEYVKAFQNLDFQYFSLHWRLLFQFARHRNTAGVFLMMKVMSFFWKRKNR